MNSTHIINENSRKKNMGKQMDNEMDTGHRGVSGRIANIVLEIPLIIRVQDTSNRPQNGIGPLLAFALLFLEIFWRIINVLLRDHTLEYWGASFLQKGPERAPWSSSGVLGL